MDTCSPPPTGGHWARHVPSQGVPEQAEYSTLTRPRESNGPTSADPAGAEKEREGSEDFERLCAMQMQMQIQHSPDSSDRTHSCRERLQAGVQAQTASAGGDQEKPVLLFLNFNSLSTPESGRARDCQACLTLHTPLYSMRISRSSACILFLPALCGTWNCRDVKKINVERGYSDTGVKRQQIKGTNSIYEVAGLITSGRKSNRRGIRSSRVGLHSCLYSRAYTILNPIRRRRRRLLCFGFMTLVLDVSTSYITSLCIAYEEMGCSAVGAFNLRAHITACRPCCNTLSAFHMSLDSRVPNMAIPERNPPQRPPVPRCRNRGTSQQALQLSAVACSSPTPEGRGERGEGERGGGGEGERGERTPEPCGRSSSALSDQVTG
ncbi:hypothetical protein JHW43_000324 [Diplocarpon mali]|nr:hypothetical protein JHW43_000324 [Diplocarpon mali]